MKKILSATIVALLASSLGFAQAAAGSSQASDSKAGQPVQKSNKSVKLNPQPEPPGVQKSGKNASPASKVALNPQPLPPGAKNTSPGSKVELNPQPLPPKEAATKKKSSSTAKSKKNSGGATTTQSPK